MAANAQTLDNQFRAFSECCATLGELSLNRCAGGAGRLGVTGSEGAAQAVKLAAISAGSSLEHLGALRIGAVDALGVDLGSALAQPAGLFGAGAQLGKLGVGLQVAGLPAAIPGHGRDDQRRSSEDVQRHIRPPKAPRPAPGKASTARPCPRK